MFDTMVKTISNMFKSNYNSILIKYKEFQKLAAIFIIFLIATMVFLMSISSIYLDQISLWLNVSSTTLGNALITLTIIFTIISIYYLRKSKNSKPTEEERTFIYAYRTIDNLEEYKDNNNLTFCLKKAAKNVSKISSRFGYWTIGGLKFISNPLGDSLADFIQYFKPKINSIIKNGSSKDIETLMPFFHQFINFLLMDNPTTDAFLRVSNNFEALNKVSKKGEKWKNLSAYLEKASSYIIKSNHAKHILHFIAIIIFTVVVFFIGTQIPDVGTGTSYMAAIVTFVPLILYKLGKMGK